MLSASFRNIETRHTRSVARTPLRIAMDSSLGYTFNFPPEILLYLVQFLKGDIRSLTRCMLTCNLLVNPCRRLRGVNTKLAFSNSSSVNKAAELFRNFPRVAEYISSLEICDHRNSKKAHDGAAISSTSPSYWIYDLAMKVGPMLVRLSSLYIEGVAFHSTHPCILPMFCRSRSLESLSLANCTFPSSSDVIRFLSSFPCLTKLRFTNIRCAKRFYYHPRSRTTSKFLRLSSLEGFEFTCFGTHTHTCTDWIADWLTKGVCLERVSVMTVKLSCNVNPVSWGRLISSCISMHELTLSLSTNPLFNYKPFGVFLVHITVSRLFCAMPTNPSRQNF